MERLLDLIAKIDQLDDEDVIFVKQDISPTSEAGIFRLTSDYQIPEEVKTLGYHYFLEVDTIRQVLEEFRCYPGASIEEKCRRIIQYAINDA